MESTTAAAAADQVAATAAAAAPAAPPPVAEAEKPPSTPRFASLAQRRQLLSLKPVAIVTPHHRMGGTARPARVVEPRRMVGKAAAGSAAAAAAARAAVKRPALVEPHHGRDAARRGGPTVAAAPGAAGEAAAAAAAASDAVWLRCAQCNRRFDTQQGLVTHAFRAHGVRKRLEERGKLMAIETNHQKSYYRVPQCDQGEKCPLCAERFIGPSSLSRHLLRDHKDERQFHFKCDECPRAYRSYDGLQKHLRIDHKRGEVSSGLSGDWEVSGVTKHVCPICAAPFRTQHRLSMHMLAEHRDTPLRHFRCDECGLGFRTLEILRKHLKKHVMRANLPFPCDACCMRFATWNGAITHQVQSHGKISDKVRSLKPDREKTVPCPRCAESFDSKRTLSDHICDICKERYRSFVSMKCHRRITHFRSRDAAFKFDCDVCSRRFRKWEGLRSHQKMMHGTVTDATQMQMYDRDYGEQCPLCKMYYQGTHSLSEHIMTAHADFEGKLFDCDECDKSYRHYAHLRAHKHTKHQMPMKFKRRATALPGGRKPMQTLAAAAPTTQEAAAQPAGGEEKEEVPVQSKQGAEPADELEEGELASEDESDSYVEDVMMSDIDSEDEEEEEVKEEKEEGECTSDEDEPTTSK